ncbi:MAG: hypothetical protein WBA10_19105 [Elainellaceae cyanobacterium]
MKLRFLAVPLVLSASLLVGACSEPAETEVEVEGDPVIEEPVVEEEVEVEPEAE